MEGIAGLIIDSVFPLFGVALLYVSLRKIDKAKKHTYFIMVFFAVWTSVASLSTVLKVYSYWKLGRISEDMNVNIIVNDNTNVSNQDRIIALNSIRKRVWYHHPGNFPEKCFGYFLSENGDVKRFGIVRSGNRIIMGFSTDRLGTGWHQGYVVISDWPESLQCK